MSVLKLMIMMMILDILDEENLRVRKRLRT